MSEISFPKEWSSIEYGDALISASNGIGGKQNKAGIGIPVSRIETIANETINFERVGYLEAYDPNKIPKHQLCKGDILFSHINSPAHLGKTALFDSDKELYHGINLLRLIVDHKLFVPRLFNYHCRLLRNLGVFSQNAQHAVNQSSLNQKKLFQFSAPLPPLAEQKVIADKLDTLLAQVENTKARLERIPQILKRFRQSVLAAAVSGRLTEQWRRLGGLPEWEVRVLGDVIGNIDQGWSPKCHSEPTSDESWGVIKTSSVLPMAFVEDENKKLPDSLDVRPKLGVLASDILTTRAGPRSRCGITCYVSNTSKNLMICDKVYRYRVIEGKGSSKFLALQLNSPTVLEKIETLKTGISESGMNLTQKKFRQLELNWPTPEEQTEIVLRVDQLFAHADRIEQQVNNALARVNNLTQSILAKAFRGELTEQWRKDNPELISGENSAEALLERIRAERTVVAKPKHRKSKA